MCRRRKKPKQSRSSSSCKLHGGKYILGCKCLNHFKSVAIVKVNTKQELLYTGLRLQAAALQARAKGVPPTDSVRPVVAPNRLLQILTLCLYRLNLCFPPCRKKKKNRFTSEALVPEIGGLALRSLIHGN